MAILRDTETSAATATTTTRVARWNRRREEGIRAAPRFPASGRRLGGGASRDASSAVASNAPTLASLTACGASDAPAFLSNPRFASMTGALHARRGSTAANRSIPELAVSDAVALDDDVSVARLMQRRPIAVVTKVLGGGFALFLAGGCAGALAKTCTAPLDRLKIIMQVSGANQQSAAAKAAASGGLIPAFIAIGKSEGLKGYWKGNVPQVIRILPYSTAMLNSYEFYKSKLAYQETGKLSVPARLASGAAAACTATLVTYPLDIIRLRLSVDPNMKTMSQVVTAILKDEGPSAFFKGLPATCLSIAPYSALNFCAFDLFKRAMPDSDSARTIAAASFMATLLASGTCYPLDTIRRQMQLKSSTYTGVVDAGVAIVARDGVGGLFKGFVPNAVKNAPNKSIQLTCFDLFKRKIKESERALEEERALYAAELKKAKGGKKRR